MTTVCLYIIVFSFGVLIGGICMAMFSLSGKISREEEKKENKNEYIIYIKKRKFC